MQLATIGNEITMTSLELVDFINIDRKDGEPYLTHANLLAKIPKVLGDTSHSYECNLPDSYGRPRKAYRFKKREACLIAMSYSYELQAKVFDRMTELEKQQAPKLPNFLDPAESAIAWAAEYKAKQLALAQIEQMKPMAEFGLAISASATEVLIGDWIKAINDGSLKMGRTKVFSWFRDQGYLNKKNQPYQQFIDQGLFKVKENLINTAFGQKATFTTLLTGKGQVYFANKLKKD